LTELVSAMTLLETTLTVAIVSVTVLVAIPPLVRARESYELNATAWQVAGNLQSARMKAISRNRDYRVRITSSVTYAIEREDTTWKLDEALIIPRGFHIAANASPEFHRRGNASPTATITVWSASGRSKKVIVNITGRVRIE
jgi:type II secretory pathway pseudopilin PulG